MLCSFTSANSTAERAVTSSPIFESLVPPQHGQQVRPGTNDASARQVIGKVPTRAVAPRRASNRYAGRLGLGLVHARRRGQIPRAAAPAGRGGAGCAPSAGQTFSLE